MAVIIIKFEENMEEIFGKVKQKTEDTREKTEKNLGEI